ncbi:MAG: hypothetical protein KJ070_04000, partial [Verrucomicrobia bacterium]|nr:hypothetical protein [Verrucomicrobiota bacterium]
KSSSARQFKETCETCGLSVRLLGLTVKIRRIYTETLAHRKGLAQNPADEGQFVVSVAKELGLPMISRLNAGCHASRTGRDASLGNSKPNLAGL